MDSIKQIALLREAEWHNWMGDKEVAHDILKQVALSLDNPNYDSQPPRHSWFKKKGGKRDTSYSRFF